MQFCIQCTYTQKSQVTPPFIILSYSKFLSLPPVPPISLSLYGHLGYTYMYSEAGIQRSAELGGLEDRTPHVRKKYPSIGPTSHCPTRPRDRPSSRSYIGPHNTLTSRCPTRPRDRPRSRSYIGPHTTLTSHCPTRPRGRPRSRL